MSKNRILLSFVAVVAIACMATESASAQLLQGRLLGRRSADCCAPAPAPVVTCGCEAPAPQRVRIIQQIRTRVAAPAPSCGCEAPAPVSTCGCATPAPVAAPAPCCGAAAPVVAPAPVAATTSCCGGTAVAPVMMDQGVVYGEPVMETSETVQASPSDSVVTEEATITSDVVEPPAAAETTPVEDN